MIVTARLPVAILAGGLATRLYPETRDIPKSMLIVAGEPFIAHQMRLLAGQGYRRIIMCIGNLGEQIEDYLRDGAAFDVEVAYSRETPESLLGTGGALRQALPLLGEAFLVLYGDSYLPTPFGPAEAHFRASGALGLMTVFRNEGRWDISNVHYRDGRIVAYSKSQPAPDMRFIDYGLGGLRREALLRYDLGARFDLAEVYAGLARDGQLTGYEASERFYEIGSFQGWVETNTYLSHSTQNAGRKK